MSRSLGKSFDDIVMGEETEVTEGTASASSASGPTVASVEQKLTDEMNSMTVAYFLFSLVWSVGGTLDEQSRIKFDDFFRALCDMEAASSKHPRYVDCLVINQRFYI